VAFRIVQYIDSNGHIPYRRWIRELDVAVQARVQARVLRFEQGNLGDHKDVGRGVWEARLDFGPGYRVYFGRDGVDVILLLVGGDKKSQKTDIKRAQDYWAIYLKGG
jgi:putative addiction module killer protein